MFIRKITFFTILFLLSFTLIAQKNIKKCCEGHISFIENKNQWDETVKFKTELTGTSVFYQKDGFVFAFEDRKKVNELMQYKLSSPQEKRTKNKPDSLLNYHAYKMTFLNSNPNVSISGAYPTEDYVNYYIGNDQRRWASEVKKYTEITYQNLYERIDLKVYENDYLLKYDFIINPHGYYKNIIGL